MKKYSLFQNLTLWSALILFPVSVSAADTDFCTDYVLVAISQYWQSVDEDCGFTGSRWNSDYKGQYNWCITTHQWIAENETQTRERLLKECRANKASKSSSAPPDQNTVRDAARADSAKESPVASKHQIPKTPTTNNKSDKTALNEQLLKAVADNDVVKLQQLYEAGADLQFVTDNPKLINRYGMSYHLGKGITIKGDGSTTVKGNVINHQPQQEKPVSESLISYAVANGLYDVGLWLLEHQKSEIPEKHRQSLKSELLGNALIAAVKKKDTQTLQTLINKDAPIDYELGMNFGTPLYFAVRDGNVQIAKLLLKKGADPKYSTNGGVNMLNYALKNIELLQLLLDHGADPDSNGESSETLSYPLMQAIKLGNIKAVDILLSKGANTEISGYDDVPYPLFLAITNNQIDIVETLLKHGANPNLIYNDVSPGECIENTVNITPLDEAEKTGNSEMIQLLKRSGAKHSKEICE